MTLTWLNLKCLPLATANSQGIPNYSTQSPFLPNSHLRTVASDVKQALQTVHPCLQRKQQYPQTKVDTSSATYASLILIRGSESNYNGWTNSYLPRMHWKFPRSCIKMKSATTFNTVGLANSVCGCFTAVSTSASGDGPPLVMMDSFVLWTRLSATPRSQKSPTFTENQTLSVG